MATSVNNDIYQTLGDRWYDAEDDPVALLRAESRLRCPWVKEKLDRFPTPPRVLDIGCGAGFLTNYLSAEGFETVGLDQAQSALDVAAERDTGGKAKYVFGDACRLPFADAEFDAVCAMDVLEHVEDPEKLIAEASRVLKPGGSFFFYTFNRTWQSYLLAVKGLEWVVRNTPTHLHLHRLFLTPAEVSRLCEKSSLAVKGFQGVAPVIFSRAFGRLLLTGKVPPSFKFQFVRSLKVGYLGEATRVTG